MNPLMLCESSSCQSSKNEYTFWMPTADVPDGIDVKDHYPASISFTEEPEKVKKFIR